MGKLSVFITALALNCARGHVAYWNTPNNLHPVQSLYVKPSVDGTTGDLYVAATEDSGMKTQWLSDQSINFLPSPSAQPAPVPFSYTSSLASLPREESVVTNQKRAVFTSPAMKYSYVAMPTGDGNAVPYPYTAIPHQTTSADGSKECGGPDAAAVPVAYPYPQYSPYQYYYPQMMSAFAHHAMGVLKEAGISEDTASSVMSQAAPMWPPGYAYPVQYFMVDPATWAQSQAAVPQPSTQATPSENLAAEAANDDA